MKTLSRKARDYLRDLIETDVDATGLRLTHREGCLAALDQADQASSTPVGRIRSVLSGAIVSARRARNLARQANMVYMAGKIEGAETILKSAQGGM